MREGGEGRGEYTIDDAGREGLFVRLSLKDFFFDCACCDEAVDETIFLLTVSPDSCKCLLICGGIPVYNQSVSAFQLEGRRPGSKRMRRFAPMRLIPQPPAFELNKKTNSGPSGSLNRSTNFCRLLTFIVPSSRRHPYLQSANSSSLSAKQIRMGSDKV